MKSLIDYNTFVFDCDGVVLNSNLVKTRAFYESTKHFGHDSAQLLVDYHVANGGVSRYLKFEYFLREIVKVPTDDSVLQDLLARFSASVMQGLLECAIAPGLLELKERTEHAVWMIVSGGDQDELKEVFRKRGLLELFSGGVFGSPDNKEVILAREKRNKNINGVALFIGDSKYDYLSAKKSGLDFVFLSDWTEVKSWQDWVAENEITSFRGMLDLIKL